MKEDNTPYPMADEALSQEKKDEILKKIQRNRTTSIKRKTHIISQKTKIKSIKQYKAITTPIINGIRK